MRGCNRNYQFTLVLVLIAVPVVAIAQDLIVPNTVNGWPNERSSNHAPIDAIDDDLITYTWTTEAFNSSTGHLGLGFEEPELTNRIRVWKDNLGDWNVALRKDLTIMYTVDSGPLSSRQWYAVSELENGYEGIELLQADAVNPDGTVLADFHDSENDGWASLTFEPVAATGICIRFARVPGESHPYVHYKVFEIQAYSPGPISAEHQSWGQVKVLFR